MLSLSHRLSRRLYLSVALYLHGCLVLINVNNLLHLSRAFVWVVVAPLPLPLPTSFALFYGILVRNSLIALLWLFEKQTVLSPHVGSTELSILVLLCIFMLIHDLPSGFGLPAVASWNPSLRRLKENNNCIAFVVITNYCFAQLADTLICCYVSFNCCCCHIICNILLLLPSKRNGSLQRNQQQFTRTEWEWHAGNMIFISRNVSPSFSLSLAICLSLFLFVCILI